jgi:hypothetical protein
VELIGDSGPESPPAPSPYAATDADILDLLTRRPCTAGGVAAGLSLHIQEAAKRLEALAEVGSVDILQKEDEIFYRLRHRAAGAGKPG